jgi:hypothetical protein
MQIQPELKSVLKRLKLSGILATLPDRYAYARQEKLDYTQFLELILSDEVERRDHVRSPIACGLPASRKNAPCSVSIGRPKSVSTRLA